MAEIVTIGDELCRGEIIDTNASWIAERLTDLGLHVRWKSSVTDDVADLAAALRQAVARAQIVVTSGGLGPTDDDRTVDVVAGIVGAGVAIDEPHRARMEGLFSARGFEVTPNNLRQVRVPGGAEVLANRAGLAPGFRVRSGEADLFSLPGVPREMKRIFDEEIAPRLRTRFAAAPHTARRVWRVIGMGESHVDHHLRGLLDGAAGGAPIDGATLHFRIAYPENLVTVVVRRGDPAAAEAVLDQLDVAVRDRLGGAVYGTGSETLAAVIGQQLRARGETVATAESCTGGLVADLITDVPGASDYFRGGVVAYADALKQSLLGVRAETLAAHGAVSEACVIEMAEGVRRSSGATWGLALSGIAGPGGGAVGGEAVVTAAGGEAKPVGLVHFAVCGPAGTTTRRLLWPSERRLVKQMAAWAVLNLLDKLLRPERQHAPELLAAAASRR